MPEVNPAFPAIEETIHGWTVRDPYRWLEDRSLPQTDEWIGQQAIALNEYFANYKQLRAIRSRVSEYLNREARDEPARVDERYFFRKRTGDQEQGNLYVSGKEGRSERVLVDPSEFGPFHSVSILRISESGRYLAYGRRAGGSDQQGIQIFDLVRNQRLPGSIPSGYGRGFVFAPDDRL